MTQFIISQEDIESMDPLLKKMFVEFLQKQIAFKKISTKISVKEDVNSKPIDGLEEYFEPNPNLINSISIETMLAVMLGLSPESIKIVESLLSGSKSRSELGDLCGGEKKLNGTIGSINRRLINRFSSANYSKDDLKYIRLINWNPDLGKPADLQ